MSDAMAPFARVWREPFAEALAFKAKGGQVVGYLSANAPVELIEAAGLFALRLDGGGVADTPRADVFLESLFDPTVRGVCERLLCGDLGFLDALILPRTTDSVQRLYYYLSEQERTGALKPPRLIFYDLLHTPGAASLAYSHAALLRVRDALAELVGHAIGDDALRAAVKASNRRAMALSACLAARRRDPARLRGGEALLLISASQRMSAESFITAAEALAPALQERAGHAGARLILAGNAPDTLDVHAALEKVGGLVVGDYHDRGELCLGAPVDLAAAPLKAISDRYVRDSHSARRFPTHAGDLAAFAQAQGAAGVVFYFYAQEEVLTWDYPDQRDALEAAGIRHLCLAGQPYRADARAIEEAAAAFVTTLPAVRR